jgi:hypothetical protein
VNTLIAARMKCLGIPTALMLLTAPVLAAPNMLRSLDSVPGPRLVKPVVTAEATKLHVVLLVFGHKGGISAACQKDCKAIKAALELAFADEDDADRLVIHDLSIKNPETGKPFTTKETLDVIKNLSAGKNDNVFIYQSGHGSIGDRNDPEMSHVLQMDGATLTRAQIQKPIEAMKPRGIIFLTDCCSGFGRKAPAPKTQPVSLVEPNLQTIRNLMLRPAGVVSITAAEDGTLAMASYRGTNPAKAGSAFTVALTRLWCNDTVYESWTDFYPDLRKETSAATGNRHTARAFHLKEGTRLIPSPVTPTLDK